MALSTREMLLVLRARDEMSRVLRGVATGFGDVDAAAMAAARNQMAAGAGLMSLGIGLASAGVAGLNFLYNATQAAAEFERQVALVRTQIDAKVIPSLEEIGNVTKRVAKEVAVPLDRMNATLYDIFSSMDVNLSQAEQLLKGFAKEAIAGQTDIQASARLTISILNTFQLPVESLGRIQDVMFQIVRKGVLTYQELSDTIGRALPATRRAGQQFEQLGGMIAFLTRNGLSAAMASTSAARAMEAFAHPKTVQRMEKMGITVRDASGNFKPLNEVITQLGQKLMGLPQPEKVAILQELFKSSGGTIQARRFFDTVLSGNDQLAQYNELVGAMTNSSGVFESAYTEMSKTTATQTDLLRNQWNLIKLDIGQALLPILMTLVQGLQNLLGWWDKLSDGQKKTIATVLAVGAALAVVVGGIITAVGFFMMLSGAAAALGISLGMVALVVTGVVLAIAAIGAGLVIAWQKSEKFREGVKKLGEFFASFWPQIVGLFKKFMEVAGPAFERIGQVLGDDVIPALNTFLAVIRPILSWLIDVLGNALIGAFEGAMIFIEGALQAISGILTLFAGLFTLNWSMMWDGIKQIGEGIWNMIKGAFEVFINLGILKVFALGKDLLVGLVTGLWTFVRNIFTGGIGFVRGIVQGGIDAIVGFFRNMVGGVMNAVGSLITRIRDFFSNALSGARNAVETGINYVILIFRDLPGKILGAIGDFGNLLFNAGKRLIEGLWRGIENAWSWVKNKISDIAGWVAGLWPFSPAKHGPLRQRPMDKAGYNLMKFLGVGIMAGAPGVMRQMSNVADSLANTAFRTSGVQMGGQPRTSLGVPSAGLAPAGGAGGGVQQIVVVYTNEIDPRSNAAELGWLLGQGALS